MLSKLIKYEWKAMRWQYAAPFLVYIIAAVFALVIGHWHSIISGLIIFGGLFALAVLMFFSFFRRYNSNLYGNEGYLMFTLPVRTEELLFSKALVSFIWFTLYLLLAIAVGVGAVFALTNNPHIPNLPEFSQIWNAVYPHIGDILLFLFYYIVAILSGILDIYFAITVSKLGIWRRFGVFMGFVAYVAINIVRGIPIWILEFVLHAKIDVSQNIVKVTQAGPAHATVTLGSVGGWFWVALLYSIAFAVGTFFLTAWIMRKYTSLK